MSSIQYCSFHEDRQTNIHCEKCNTTICSECIMIYNEHQTRTTVDDTTVTYTVPREYCPPCYYERLEKDQRPYNFLCPIIFMIIFIYFVGTAILSSMDPEETYIKPILSTIFIGMPIIIIIVMIIKLIHAPEKIRSIRYDREMFFDRIQEYKNKKMVKVSEQNIKDPIYCKYCGHIIRDTAKDCEICGKKIDLD